MNKIDESINYEENLNGFNKNDICTLKFLNVDKLNYYINYLKSRPKIKIKIMKDEIYQNIWKDFYKSEKAYDYADEDYSISDIFLDYSISQPKDMELNIYKLINKILKTNEYLDKISPSLINMYVENLYAAFDDYDPLLARSINNGYLLRLLEILKSYSDFYNKKSDFYDSKLPKEELISTTMDCENGVKAGNLSACTNANWEEDWKEFIKHDHQWDFGFFIKLILHKLELMEKYFRVENNHIIIESDVKRIHNSIKKALRLGYKLDKTSEWDEEKYKKAANDFFLYLAENHLYWWE